LFILFARLVTVGVQRVTVSLPKETETLAKDAAKAAGLSVSAWIARAVVHEAQFQDAVAEVEAYVETLDVPEEVRRKAEAVHARLVERSGHASRMEAS
jgi:uncharacterized protein (DUF1778 family)